jgi:hypothetical protein
VYLAVAKLVVSAWAASHSAAERKQGSPFKILRTWTSAGREQRAMHRTIIGQTDHRVVVSVLLVLAVSSVVMTSCQNDVRRERVRSTAERLKYDPALVISEVERCWDVFAHCGQLLFYRTGQSNEELERRIDGLGWIRLNQEEVDGYEIFTNINLGTRSRITIDGSDGMGDRSSLPRFRANRWRLSDPDGRTWTITHFPLLGRPNVIALDGMPLQENIVVVQYQIR